MPPTPHNGLRTTSVVICGAWSDECRPPVRPTQHSAAMSPPRAHGALTLAAAVLALLCSGCSASQAISDDWCALLSSCADCTCLTPAYRTDDPCKSGCAWLVNENRCVSAATANASAAAAFYSLWVVGNNGEGSRAAGVRKRYIEAGKVTCDLERGELECSRGSHREHGLLGW